MRRIFVLALALCAVAAAPAPTPTPTPAPSPDTKAQVDAVFAEYDRSDSPGCALGVYRDGKIVYARGYGMANLELGVANSAQTVFDIGSTSKQFTAFSIQLLAREGKLSLDDDIRKWLPEIPAYEKTITIRQMLHHTSGLRDYLVAHGAPGPQGRGLDDGARRSRHPVAAEGAQLSSRSGVPLQQHGLLPSRRHRQARERPAVAGVRAGADLRAARACVTRSSTSHTPGSSPIAPPGIRGSSRRASA